MGTQDARAAHMPAHGFVAGDVVRLVVSEAAPAPMLRVNLNYTGLVHGDGTHAILRTLTGGTWASITLTGTPYLQEEDEPARWYRACTSVDWVNPDLTQADFCMPSVLGVVVEATTDTFIALLHGYWKHADFLTGQRGSLWLCETQCDLPRVIQHSKNPTGLTVKTKYCLAPETVVTPNRWEFIGMEHDDVFWLQDCSGTLPNAWTPWRDAAWAHSVPASWNLHHRGVVLGMIPARCVGPSQYCFCIADDHHLWLVWGRDDGIVVAKDLGAGSSAVSCYYMLTIDAAPSGNISWRQPPLAGAGWTRWAIALSAL
jgi:hypothetical protein